MQTNPYESPPSDTPQPGGTRRYSLLGIVLGLLCVVALAFALIMFLAPIVLIIDAADWDRLGTGQGSIFLIMIVGSGIASLLLASAAWFCFQSRWKRASISFVVGACLAGGLAWLLQFMARR